jgi:hypothetical protein
MTRKLLARIVNETSDRFDRLVQDLYVRRHGACQTPVARMPAVADDPDYRIVRIDDPEGASIVLALRGMVHQASIDALRDEIADLRPPHAVYLDFTEAVIMLGPAMSMLGQLIDAIEARELSVRVVGISPGHPALRQLHPMHVEHLD